MKGKNSAVLALALASVCLMSCNKTTYEVVEGEPDYSKKAAANVMRIGAWVAPPPANWNNLGNPDFITDESYQAIEDSGINTIYALYEINSRADTKRAALLAEKHHVSYLARDYAIDVDPVALELNQGEMHASTSSYDSISSVKGFLVADEPGVDKFDQLGRLKKYYEKEYPGKEFYVNLFPTYASTAAQLQTTDYKDYIDQFITKVSPDFISYDHYALSVDGYGKYHITDDVLYNLEVVSSRCQKAGIPMYTFAQAMSYDAVSRCPDESEVRWQVMTEMAYGSRSIQYFCYFTPLEFTQGSPAMITKDGQKTDQYAAVTNVNKELAGMDEAYLDFSYVGTMPVYGTNNSAKSNKCFKMLEEPLKEIPAISDVSLSEDSLIGAFKAEDKREGFLITNFTDPKDKKTDSVSLKFNGASSVLVYHAGTSESKKLDNGKFVYSLVPGDGVFVVPYK
jgi:hypothetical protein